MKRILLLGLGVLVSGSLIWGGVYYWNHLRGVWPAIQPPPEDIATIIEEAGENRTDIPLEFPSDFSIAIYAKNLPGVRVIKAGPLEGIWVSQPSQGTVSLLETREGQVTRSIPIFQNLNSPHGLAFDPENPFMLYIAEEDKIVRTTVHSDAPLEKIADLPTGGRHTTRTLGFGPDGRLYVSIGSSCDVCYEEDERRGTIYVMNKDGSNMHQFATGLRNAVFFTWHPQTQELWATEMGRDNLGDNLPPDEINIVQEGGNYGWPECYGNNVLDTRFHSDNHQHIRAHCTEPFELANHIDIQAHSAPLGLAFFSEDWPEEYAHDLLVAYHGSWNRTEPTGYKIVRYMLDASGNVEGQEVFISGWLTEDDRSLGRPVDILINDAEQEIYVSDDKAGVIYKITHHSNS